MTKGIRLTIAIGSILADAALAQPSTDLGAFVGLAVGATDSGLAWQENPANLGRVRDDSGVKLIGGLRPLLPLAVEFEFIDLGAASAPLFVVCATGDCVPQHVSIESRAVSASAVGIATVGPAELFGKFGLSRWDVERRPPFTAPHEADGSGTIAAVGVQVELFSFALRFEAEEFDFDDEGENRLISIGFTRPIR